MRRSGDRWHELSDRIAGSDPGATRLLSALRAVIGVVAVMFAEEILLGATGALQISAGHGVSSAAAALQHHQTVVVAVLLCGTLALVTGFAINDPTPGEQLVSMLVAPLFVIPALAIGLSIGGHRFWTLCSFPVLLAFGGYCRRFGPRGFISGILLFIGDFIGFLLHGTLDISDIGWLAAEVATATLALIAVRFLFFYPRPDKTLLRLQRSYQARASRVAELALAVLDDPGPRERKRLAKQLVRLNEAALLIDAQLPGGAKRLHQRLFDIELALTNIARFTEAMAVGTLTDVAREAVRRALQGLRSGDLLAAQRASSDLLAALRSDNQEVRSSGFARVIPHRFALSVGVYAEATGEWLHLGRTGELSNDPDQPFSSVVEVRSGWLPGAASVSADAAISKLGSRRKSLPLNVRSAIQMAVAVAGAVAIGDAISPRRFYWAVLAAFLAFVGTSHVAEQVRKAVYRVVGTLVGIVAGSALVRLVGHDTTASLTLVMIALFFGVYLFRISYAFMVIAITIAISQVYVQLDEYSTSLLITRLVETAVGSGVALVVVIVILPLRTSDVFGFALGREIEALRHLALDAMGRMTEPGRPVSLRNDARELDAAHQALVSTAAPLRWTTLSEVNRVIGTTLAAASAARHYGRNLVADVEAADDLDERTRDDLVSAGAALSASMDVVVAAAGGDRSGTYIRSAALFDRVDHDLEDASRADPRRLVLRDLTLVDGALARIAAAAGLAVTSLDTGSEPLDAGSQVPSGA